MSNHSPSHQFDLASVHSLLDEIGREFAAQGKVAEIALYGGAALMLMFDTRPLTRDIDFVAMQGGGDEIAAVADSVGERHGLESGWFNDAVRMFSSPHAEHRFFGDFPDGSENGLRVFVASPEYILSMKLLAMRSSLESSDVFDIWNLIDICGLETPDQAQKWLAKFFPDDALPERNACILADLFEAKSQGKAYDPMIGW